MSKVVCLENGKCVGSGWSNYHIAQRSYFVMVFWLFFYMSRCSGIAAYTAEQKRKEIAIRKILGATITSVLMLLSNYFVRAAILSVIISTPFAWMAMDKYLQEFYYRIDVP